MATAMTTYTVVTPVLADKRYAPGSSIQLSDKDAAPLLKSGAVKLPGPPPAPPAPPAPAPKLAPAIKAATTANPAPASQAVTTAIALEKMSVAQLKDYAAKNKIEINPAWSQDEMVKALAAAATLK
jgi:hypothetical protein